jgi:hypothetical protein
MEAADCILLGGNPPMVFPLCPGNEGTPVFEQDAILDGNYFTTSL